MSEANHDGDAVSSEMRQPGIFWRLILLAGALGMMWLVRALRVEAAGGAADPLTLAACGFVLLASFTVGELGAGLGLPKVTGYILAGVLVGPQVGEVLSDAVVTDLTIFNQLALGLIAISAGLELNLPAIRKVARTLGATVVAKVALLPLLVGVPLLLEERFLGSFGLHETNEQLAFALIISVLGIGTSPAIALAVVNDTGARGRLSDLLLAISVVKDVVVVTCLAIAIAISHALLEGGSFSSDALVHLGGHLASEVIVGVLVGVALIAYFRVVAIEPLFTALVAVLFVAEIANFLHLDLLLPFIVAGFVVRNFSPFEHDLLHPIEQIALPVFVVFFTTAGAKIPLGGTLEILHVAAVLAGMRALTYLLSSRVGAVAGGESPAVASNAWLTYLPQAGVTLGLVGVAAEKLPEIGEHISKLGVALVAIHLLVGPVTLTLGLRRSGEVRREAPEGEAEGAVSGPTAVPAPEIGEGLPRSPTDVLPDPEELAAELPAPELAEAVRDVARQIETSVRSFVEGSIHPHAAALASRAEALVPGEDTRALQLRHIRRALSEPAPWERSLLERRAGRVFDEVSAMTRALRWEIEVPLDEVALDVGPGASLMARARRVSTSLRWRLARLTRRTARRSVPLQLALRLSIEPRLAEALLEVNASFHRAEAEVLSCVRGMAQGTRPTDPASVAAIARRWVMLAEHTLTSALRAAFVEAVGTLRIVGGPALPTRSLRFADVETRIGETVHRLSSEERLWQERLAAAEDTLRAALLAETFVDRLESALGRRAVQPLVTCREAMLPALGEVAQRLEAVASSIDRVDGEHLAAVTGALDHVLTHALANTLHRTSARFRRGTQPGPLVAELAEVMRNAPGRLSVLSRQTPLYEARRPGLVVVREISFAEVVEAVLHDDLLPAVNGALAPVAEIVAAVEGRVREAVTVARYGSELAAREGFDSDTERRAVVVDAIGRGVRRIRQLAEELDGALARAHETLGEAAISTTAQLRELSVDEGRAATVRSVRTSLRAAAGAAREAGRAAAARVVALGRTVWSLTDQQALRDLKIRSGHEQLDATGIREYLDSYWPSPEARGIPTVYARLMAPAPVTERRLFVARLPMLESVLAALAPDDTRASSTVVVGPAGSGRTSLMNMVKMQLVGPRLLWLDSAFSARADGPLRALATELGTPAELQAVAAALEREPTAVLIDDLHSWIEPSTRGLAELERMLEVLDHVSPRTKWLVSVEGAAFDLLDEVVPLKRRFRRLLRLPALDWQQLMAIFDQREQLGGFDTDLRPRGLVGRATEIVRPGGHKETYYRALARASNGNPGTASIVHLQGVSLEGDVLRAGTPSTPELPFLGQLGDDMLAVLAAFARFGAMDPRWLCPLLGCSEPALASWLGFLVHAGLIEERRLGAARIGLTARLAPAIRQELVGVGALKGGAS